MTDTRTFDVKVTAYLPRLTEKVIEDVQGLLDADWRLVDPILGGHLIEPYYLELSTKAIADNQRQANLRARTAFGKALKQAGVVRRYRRAREDEAVFATVHLDDEPHFGLA